MEFTPSNTAPLWEGDHLSKDAFVRWRNHTLSPTQVVTVSEHLAICEQCRDRLAAPTSLLLLAQALDNGQDELALLRQPELKHLNFELMEAFVDELLTPAGRRNVERHLAICEVCSAQVADLRAVQRDLRDWQISSQNLPESVDTTLTTANGTSPHHVAALQPDSAPTFVVPPMRVTWASGENERSRSGWRDILRNVQRYLLPLETAGVAVAAVFLLLIIPTQQKLELLSEKYDDIAKQKKQVDAVLARDRNQSNRSDIQIGELKNSVASLDKQSATTQQKVRQLTKDKAVLSSQFNETQLQLSETRSKLEEAKSQLSALEEQRRRDFARGSRRPFVSATPATPRPTSPPQNTTPLSRPNVQIFSDGPSASIFVQDGRAVRVTNVQALPDDVARVLSQGLQTPASVKALNVEAPTTRSAEAQIRLSLISPVATRVREVRPVLRWKEVRSATHYQINIIDETDQQADTLPSERLTQPQWQPDEPLIRGHSYSWEVTALNRGQRIGQAMAKFEVLTQVQEDNLRAELGAVQDSPLQKSMVLAKAGVMNEAQYQLSLVIRPKPSFPPASP